VLSRPFQPLTLQRPMQLFPKALSLVPGSPGLPSDDFIANFLTGRRTHLAIVRQGFGADFRNFKNYALKRVETTPAVRRRLIQALDGNAELLEVMADAMRDATLVSKLAGLTRAAEGALYQVMQALSSGSMKCVHCKAELVSRPAQWWSMQSCVLGEAEYRFVDRLLCDVLAVKVLGVAFRGQWSLQEQALSSLAGLCEPGAHPFKHWLDLVRVAYRAKDLTALATRARLDGPSPDNHLQRCSRGEMLTVETINNLTERLEHSANLRNLGMQARVLAFAMDFLVAAHAGTNSLGWDAAQAIVKARIEQLNIDMRLSVAAVS
ncbi:MAG: hypothetical protein V4772_11820, partial [Pseudomonadota bacterium]